MGPGRRPDGGGGGSRRRYPRKLIDLWILHIYRVVFLVKNNLLFNYLSITLTQQFMQYDIISTLLQYCSIQIKIIWYFVVFFLHMEVLHWPGWSLLILYAWGITRNETLVPVIVDRKIPYKLTDIFCCFIILVPYRLAGGTLGLLAVCLSVSPSVCPLPFSFLDFSLPSFEILNWYLVYELELTQYRSSSSFVTRDILLQELMPFVKIKYSTLFSVVFWCIDLKLCIWFHIDIIQIKFEFRRAWHTFTRVIALRKNVVFQIFHCSL